MSDLGACTYGHAAPVTLSDTIADPAGPFDALEATTGAGLAKVTLPNGSTVTVYLIQGVPKTLTVSRVWVNGTAATGVLGYRGAASTVA